MGKNKLVGGLASMRGEGGGVCLCVFGRGIGGLGFMVWLAAVGLATGSPIWRACEVSHWEALHERGAKEQLQVRGCVGLGCGG